MSDEEKKDLSKNSENKKKKTADKKLVVKKDVSVTVTKMQETQEVSISEESNSEENVDNTPKITEDKSSSESQKKITTDSKTNKAKKKVYKVVWDKPKSAWLIQIKNKKEIISEHNTKKSAVDKAQHLAKKETEPTELIVYKMDGNVNQKLYFYDDKEKSRKQKSVQMDRVLSRSLEAKEAAKRKDLRDPISRKAMSAGQWLRDHSTSILIILILAVVVTYLIINSASTSATNQRTKEVKLASSESIPDLKSYLAQEKTPDQRMLIYIKLFSAYENDDLLPEPQKTKDLIAYTNNFINEFEAEPKYSVVVSTMKSHLQEWKINLAVLQKKEEADKAEIKKPENNPEILASSDTKPLLVKLSTLYGDLELELFDIATPNTVNALIYLIKEGFYDEDGPGGFIKRESSSSGVDRLTFGEFPASGYQNKTKKYEELKDTDDRVKKLAPKWETKFNERSVGWALPFEPQGIQQSCKTGAVILWLEDNSRPRSGSTKFSILLDEDRDLDGKYVVIGSLKRFADDMKPEYNQKIVEIPLDSESLNVASQISVNGTPIKFAQILRLKAKRRNVEIFTKDAESNFVPEKNLTLIENKDGKEFTAVGIETADFIKVLPGKYEFIPAGSYYKQLGQIVKAEKDTYLPLHDEKITKFIEKNASLLPPGTAYMPFFTSVSSATLAILNSKNIPVYVDEIDKDGKLLAKDYLPEVLYSEQPLPMKVRKKNPTKVGPFKFTDDVESPYSGGIESPTSQPPTIPPGANFGGDNGGLRITPQ